MSRARPATQAAPPLGSVVEVTWLDAAFDLDDPPPLYTLRTYGFLMEHSESRLLIASEGDGKYFRSYTAIPTGWVLSVKRLIPGN